MLYSRKGIAQYHLKDENYKDSFKKAVVLYDIGGEEKLKGMLLKFCKENKIEISFDS